MGLPVVSLATPVPAKPVFFSLGHVVGTKGNMVYKMKMEGEGPWSFSILFLFCQKG